MKQFIAKIKEKQNLTFDESKAAFEILMEGKANDQEIFDFLTLLSAKGEASDEIAGGVYVLRDKSKRVNVDNCIDTCGTGGDGMNTLNISTASALLLASMGVKVAKHGNKAVSSKCGSGDVLEALNILKKLNGKKHNLVSSVCISKNGSMIWNHTDKAALTMKSFSENDLKIYLAKIKDEALYAYNVYQIEGEGRNLFIDIQGDEDTIMGLPVKKIKEYLNNYK